MKYVIDTNILIKFERFAPPEFHQTFWKYLLKNVENGNIIIIEDIDKEWKAGKLKKPFSKHITKVADNVREKAVQINNKYGLITEDIGGKIKSKADPVLIAYAQVHNCSVFTDEGYRKTSNDPMKIPDVCKQLNIHCQRLPSHVFEAIDFPKI